MKSSSPGAVDLVSGVDQLSALLIVDFGCD